MFLMHSEDHVAMGLLAVKCIPEVAKGSKLFAWCEACK